MTAPSHPESKQGIIAWFANNSVAANLLMILIVVFGIVSAFQIRKQTTPDFELNAIQIIVPYPGAAPQEVEQGVLTKVEEAIQDVTGIDEVNASAQEGSATVTIDVSNDTDLDQVVSQVKTRVDAISGLPELTEKPIIEKIEIPIPVIFISVYGDLDAYARKELARDIREDLIAIPEVNEVEYLGNRDYEISIEVSEATLQSYDLTMTEIADAIRAAARDIPGGTIETTGGDVLLRTQGQVYTGAEYGDLTLRTFADGSRLTLDDIATIDDGFVDDDGFGRLNTQPVITMQVLAAGQQSELKTAALVRDYVAKAREKLPDTVKIETWVDRSRYLEQRLDLMLSNLAQGALLVFIVLTLFLRLKFALWVVIGIPVTFFGAIWLMPYTPWPVTINMISLFSFILVLGIVVDDAIIIGESIYTQTRADGHSVDNVVLGARKVAVTATFGVLTTIAAFTPMLFVGGLFGPFLEAVAAVVALCLLFSLVESKLILPSHLAHSKTTPVDESEIFSPYRTVRISLWPKKFIERAQRRTQHGLHWLVDHVYAPLLNKAIASRGVCLAIFLSTMLLVIGSMIGGVVKLVIAPKVPGEFVQMNLEMQNGTATSVRNETLLAIERDLYAVRDEYMATNANALDPLKQVATFTTSSTGGQIIIEMPASEDQTLTGTELNNLWREKVGLLPGVRELSFNADLVFGGGPPLSFAFTGSNFESLERAAADLVLELKDYEGVFDIRSSANPGGDEIKLDLKPTAEPLGITLSALGTQVRQAFFGEEVQRIQRRSDELKVMLRYPESQRRSIEDLETMFIVTPTGDRVPFYEVATAEIGAGYSQIRRQNGKRTVTVSADLNTDIVQPGKVIEDVGDSVIPEILSKYSGVEYALEGASADEQEFFNNFLIAFGAALFLIYALIAIPLRSYSQPLIIMSVIPFGFIGAVLGHLLLGEPISLFSLIGLLALSGVVVNDSLIMIDFVNQARATGLSAQDAVIQSGKARFRAIVLTSLTTAAGLVPIMFEQSAQAQFVIPMAISMSFGILFATMITLILVPVLYLLLLDAKHGFANSVSSQPGPRPMPGR
ncbi:MAG: efflux RND transporter permease subunit [Pseudomonadota bacterium]